MAIEPFEEELAPAADASEARLSAIVADHFDFIWRLLRRSGLSPSDADDAVQHVFMTATQKLSRIQPGAERSFLYGIAVRVAANVRRAKSRRSVEQPLLDVHEDVDNNLDDRMQLARAWSLLDDLLGQMPSELARVLALVEIEELQVKEVAALERIPEGTAASRLRRAREKFQQLLAEASSRNPFRGEP